MEYSFCCSQLNVWFVNTFGRFQDESSQKQAVLRGYDQQYSNSTTLRVAYDNERGACLPDALYSLPAYLTAYLPAHLPACPPACLPDCLPSCSLACLPA